MELAGSHILITGAGRRVGAGLVRFLAARGAHLFVHCRHSVGAAEALIDSLPGGCLKHRLITADFQDPDAAESMFRQCGGAVMDVLINNASVYRRSGLIDGADADWEEHLLVNYRMPLALTRLFVAQCGARPGAVINLLDSEVDDAVALDGGYSLSKRLLRDATLSLARELAPQVRVNGLAPGPVLAPDALAHLRMRDTLPKIPLRQAPTLEQLGDGCRFLIENDAVTGLILFIDGGYHLVGGEVKRQKKESR